MQVPATPNIAFWPGDRFTSGEQAGTRQLTVAIWPMVQSGKVTPPPVGPPPLPPTGVVLLEPLVLPGEVPVPTLDAWDDVLDVFEAASAAVEASEPEPLPLLLPLGLSLPADKDDTIGIVLAFCAPEVPLVA
jgi:hypothetical protein